MYKERIQRRNRKEKKIKGYLIYFYLPLKKIGDNFILLSDKRQKRFRIYSKNNVCVSYKLIYLYSEQQVTESITFLTVFQSVSPLLPYQNNSNVYKVQLID